MLRAASGAVQNRDSPGQLLSNKMAITMQNVYFRLSELFAFEGELKLWGCEKVVCTLDFPAADRERREAVLKKRLPLI